MLKSSALSYEIVENNNIYLATIELLETVQVYIPNRCSNLGLIDLRMPLFYLMNFYDSQAAINFEHQDR